MSDDLPTPRNTLATGYVAVRVWCRACKHSADADLQALVDAGRGDVPLRPMPPVEALSCPDEADTEGPASHPPARPPTRRVRPCAVFLVISLAVSANAAPETATTDPTVPQFFTGKMLLNQCHGANNDINHIERWTLAQGICQGYVFGVADMGSVVRGNGVRLTFCIPDHADPNYVYGTVLAYLDKQAARLDVAAASLVAEALAQEFPCPG